MFQWFKKLFEKQPTIVFKNLTDSTPITIAITISGTGGGGGGVASSIDGKAYGSTNIPDSIVLYKKDG